MTSTPTEVDPPSQVRRLANGETFLVAVQFDPHGNCSGGGIFVHPRRAPLLERALQADAVRALQHSASIAAAVCLAAPRQVPDRAAPIASSEAVAISRLGGSSFGLALLLGEAAAQLQVCLPDDLVVTGAVDTDGTLLEVTEVEAKLRVVRSLAPWVTRFMLPAANMTDSVREVAKSVGLELFPVSTGGAAIHLLFPTFLADLRARRGWSLAAFAELLLHETANLKLRPAFWRTLAPLLDADRASYASASPLVRSKLGVVASVARRRLGEPVVVSSEEHQEVLKSLPRERALTTLAHLVQAAVLDQATEAAQLRAWLRDVRLREPFQLSAKAMQARFLHASAAELRVYGAFARFELCWGDAEVAFRMNGALFRAWLRISPGDASYPLTQIIAQVALEEGRSPAHATRVVDQWISVGGTLTDGSRFVAVALELAATLRAAPELAELANIIRSERQDAGRSRGHQRHRGAHLSGPASLLQLWREQGDAAASMPAFRACLESLDPVQRVWILKCPYPTLREKLAIFPWSLQ